MGTVILRWRGSSYPVTFLPYWQLWYFIFVTWEANVKYSTLEILEVEV